MILRRIVSNLLICYVLTVIIESLAAIPAGVRSKDGQLTVFLANSITNPLMNSLLTAVSFFLSPTLYYWFLVPFEIIVVLTEGFIYKRNLSVKLNPFLLSFILNLCSYTIGTLILNFTNIEEILL